MSTFILLLARGGVGDFFKMIAFRRAAILSTLVRQSLALSLIFLAATCFSGVVNSEYCRLGRSLGGMPFVSTILLGDSLVVFLASRERLLGVMLSVVVLL